MSRRVPLRGVDLRWHEVDNGLRQGMRKAVPCVGRKKVTVASLRRCTERGKGGNGGCPARCGPMEEKERGQTRHGAWGRGPGRRQASPTAGAMAHVREQEDRHQHVGPGRQQKRMRDGVTGAPPGDLNNFEIIQNPFNLDSIKKQPS
jgi:hypothetical protein